jgi:transcriptional regulator GlxA family with amidase domain
MYIGDILVVLPAMSIAAPDPRITWILEYMTLHLAEPLAIGTLAARVHLSPSRFRALFTAQTGVGPAQYLQALRLGRARLLLERTCLSVREVMTLVGYHDPVTLPGTSAGNTENRQACCG